MSMISAQVDELRAMAESVGLAMPQAATLMMGAADAIKRLEAENAKLRELVRIAVKYCDSGTCDGCPIQGESGSCSYSDMARELGVEVDG